MEHEAILRNRIGQLRTRIRLLVTQQWVCIALAAAIAVCSLMAVATKLHWHPYAIDWIWAVVLFGVALGVIIGLTRQISPMAAAQLADERMELKERLSSGLDFATRGQRSDITEAQIADAAQHVRDLRAAQVFPWKPPRQWRWLAGSVALFVASIVVPDLPILHSKEAQEEKKIVAEQGAKLEEVAKKQLKDKKPGDNNAEIMRRILENQKALGEEMRRGRLTKKQAMLKMQDLMKQMKEQQAKLGANSGTQPTKSLDEAAKELQKQATEQAAKGKNESAKALADMARALQNKDGKEAGRQLEELARKMKEGKMTAQEAEQLSEAMRQMAQAMQGTEMKDAAPQLQQAAEALKNAAQQNQNLQQALEKATTPQQRQQLQQQMQQAMQQGLQQASSQCAQAGGT